MGRNNSLLTTSPASFSNCGLLVDELLLEREEIAFNAGSTMVSLVMRATDFARLSDAQPCRFAQAPPGG